MIEFTLNINQVKALTEWRKSHNCSRYSEEHGMTYNGAIGGSNTYSFTPTGLGTICKVKCCCGEEIDLTNYDEW